MGEIVTYQKKISNIRELLEKSKTQLALALPKHMNPDRMLRIAMTSVQHTPRLLDCSPVSLIGAIIQAAQLGLEPDGVLGHAYLVPFKQTVVFIAGYKGLIDLARRSGEVGRIYARIVYEKDEFKVSYGLNENLEHIPTSDDDPGPIIGAYAVAHLKDGTPQMEWMWKREIDAIRARSKAANDGPWVTDYQEMAKKTVLRRLCKMLPASVELATAVALDERAEGGIPQDLELLATEAVDITPEEEQPPPGKKLDELAKQIKNKDLETKDTETPKPEPIPDAEQKPANRISDEQYYEINRLLNKLSWTKIKLNAWLLQTMNVKDCDHLTFDEATTVIADLVKFSTQKEEEPTPTPKAKKASGKKGDLVVCSNCKTDIRLEEDDGWTIKVEGEDGYYLCKNCSPL